MCAFFAIWHCLHWAVNYHCCLRGLFFLLSEFVCFCLHVVLCIFAFDFHLAALQKPTGTFSAFGHSLLRDLFLCLAEEKDSGSFRPASAREHVFVPMALYRILSPRYCLHKNSCAKTPWLQICVTVLKNQGKSCLRQYTVLSMHPLSNPLSALHRLLPDSKHRMSTFQINVEIPYDAVNCSSKHGSYCSPAGEMAEGWGGCFCSSPLAAVNNTMHGATTVIFMK